LIHIDEGKNRIKEVTGVAAEERVGQQTKPEKREWFDGVCKNSYS
jgi:hypothetical protein